MTIYNERQDDYRQMKKKEIRGIIFAVLTGICWGFSGTMGQYLFSAKNMDTGWLTTVRMICSGAILLLITFFTQRPKLKAVWQRRETTIHMILTAVFGLMLVQYAYLAAIKYTNAGTGTAMQYLGETFLLLVTCITMKRLPQLIEVLGLIFAMVGVFLISTHGNLHSMVMTKQGLFWGIIAALTLMLYTLLPVKLVQEFGALVVTGYGMLIGGLVLLVIERPWRTKVQLDIQTISAMAAVILVGTVLSYTIYLQSAADIGGVKAGLLAAVETISAPTMSAIWLGTKFTLPDILGFAFIIAMVILLAVPGLKAQKKEEQA